MSREPLEVFFFSPRPPLSLAPVINFNSKKPGPGTCSEPASWVLRPCFLRLFPHQQYWGKELSWAFCGWASSPARGTSHVPGCGSGMLRAGMWGGNGICWTVGQTVGSRITWGQCCPGSRASRSVEGLSLSVHSPALTTPCASFGDPLIFHRVSGVQMPTLPCLGCLPKPMGKAVGNSPGQNSGRL